MFKLHEVNGINSPLAKVLNPLLDHHRWWSSKALEEVHEVGMRIRTPDENKMARDMAHIHQVSAARLEGAMKAMKAAAELAKAIPALNKLQWGTLTKMNGWPELKDAHAEALRAAEALHAARAAAGAGPAKELGLPRKKRKGSAQQVG